jgi:hypothetical protein
MTHCHRAGMPQLCGDATQADHLRPRDILRALPPNYHAKPRPIHLTSEAVFIHPLCHTVNVFPFITKPASCRAPVLMAEVAQASSTDATSARHLEKPTVPGRHTRHTRRLASLGPVSVGKDSYCT